MIKIFKRKIRKINKSTVTTIPKHIVDDEKLILGQEYEFIIKIPEPKNV